MNVVIDITRKKINDEIHELFSFMPHHSYLKEHSRKIFYILWQTRNENCLASRYKLLRTEELDFGFLFVYQYNNLGKTPKLMEKITINYMPVLGKKTCTKCIHVAGKEKNLFCAARGIKLLGDYFHKCDYWTEK